jgi:hypothetical protein
LTGDDFKLGSWLLNIPRGLAYFFALDAVAPARAEGTLDNEFGSFWRALFVGEQGCLFWL